MCHPGDKVKSRFKTTAAADSPIAEFSKCHEWWTTGSESPGVLGAKEAANKWKLQDMKYYTAYTGWNGGQKVTPELDQGSDWVVTWQYGCTQGTVDASTTASAEWYASTKVCGCREMWCPITDWKFSTQSSSGGKYNRSKCYSSKQGFACWGKNRHFELQKLTSSSHEWLYMPKCKQQHTATKNEDVLEQQAF